MRRVLKHMVVFTILGAGLLSQGVMAQFTQPQNSQGNFFLNNQPLNQQQKPQSGIFIPQQAPPQDSYAQMISNGKVAMEKLSKCQMDPKDQRHILAQVGKFLTASKAYQGSKLAQEIREIAEAYHGNQSAQNLVKTMDLACNFYGNLVCNAVVASWHGHVQGHVKGGAKFEMTPEKLKSMFDEAVAKEGGEHNYPHDEVAGWAKDPYMKNPKTAEDIALIKEAKEKRVWENFETKSREKVTAKLEKEGKLPTDPEQRKAAIDVAMNSLHDDLYGTHKVPLGKDNKPTIEKKKRMVQQEKDLVDKYGFSPNEARVAIREMGKYKILGEFKEFTIDTHKFSLNKKPHKKSYYCTQSTCKTELGH